MIKGKIVHTGNYAVEVEEGKTYYCVNVERAVINLFVMVLMVKQILIMLLLPQRKLAMYIFVDANKHPIDLFVMEVI